MYINVWQHALARAERAFKKASKNFEITYNLQRVLPLQYNGVQYGLINSNKREYTNTKNTLLIDNRKCICVYIYVCMRPFKWVQLSGCFVSIFVVNEFAHNSLLQGLCIYRPLYIVHTYCYVCADLIFGLLVGIHRT